MIKKSMDSIDKSFRLFYSLFLFFFFFFSWSQCKNASVDDGGELSSSRENAMQQQAFGLDETTKDRPTTGLIIELRTHTEKGNLEED